MLASVATSPRRRPVPSPETRGVLARLRPGGHHARAGSLHPVLPRRPLDKPSGTSWTAVNWHRQRRTMDDAAPAADTQAQHIDLSQSLIELLADIWAGRKQLKVYRQMKMYNDPTLNPYLYRSHRRAG